MHYNCHILPNGLRIIHRRTEGEVVYAGVYVNVGSRIEGSQEEGIAHFIEHAIFKGTIHRRSGHIRNRIDGVGGELDAFTTKEETCIYATALKEHLGRCLELFADLLQNATFPDEEIEKEKDVVVEEINLYRDSPSELIFDDFEERFFGNHPLAHNILGNKRNVKHFTTTQIRDFFHRHYTSDKMVVSVVGNVDFDRLVKMCARYFGGLVPATRVMGEADVRGTMEVVALKPFRVTVNRRTHQVHMLIGCAAPTLYADDKCAFTLLNNMLGGPAMNSRLNVSVRERHGFCYSIESQYVPFTDSGIFYIYAGVDEDAAEQSTHLILSELHRFGDSMITSQQLRAAQRQLIGQMAITNDSGLNEMQSIGKAYLNYDHVDTLEEMNRDILAVTPGQLCDTAKRYLQESKLCFLYYR